MRKILLLSATVVLATILMCLYVYNVIPNPRDVDMQTEDIAMSLSVYPYFYGDEDEFNNHINTSEELDLLYHNDKYIVVVDFEENVTPVRSGSGDVKLSFYKYVDGIEPEKVGDDKSIILDAINPSRYYFPVSVPTAVGIIGNPYGIYHESKVYKFKVKITVPAGIAVNTQNQGNAERSLELDIHTKASAQFVIGGPGFSPHSRLKNGKRTLVGIFWNMNVTGFKHKSPEYDLKMKNNTGSIHNFKPYWGSHSFTVEVQAPRRGRGVMRLILKANSVSPKHAPDMNNNDRTSISIYYGD